MNGSTRLCCDVYSNDNCMLIGENLGFFNLLIKIMYLIMNINLQLDSAPVRLFSIKIKKKERYLMI